MRHLLSISLVAAAVSVLASPALALEKTTVRAIDPAEDWNAGTTGTLRYYNNCTGWVWVWSGWSAGETLGVDFYSGPCYPNYRNINTTWALTFSGVPSGYGFTGTISVNSGGACGPVLSSQSYLPPVTSGWNATFWGGIPMTPNFSVNITWQAASGFTNPTGIASDHPLAGPTGPAACGTCFPTTRVSSSRYYGVGGAYCPSGVTLSDGLCDIEWMIETNIKCTIGVEQQSWGQIKSLYR